MSLLVILRDFSVADGEDNENTRSTPSNVPLQFQKGYCLRS